jgi:putative effector of murein hydrolase LrgA (UPF0299 family)
LPTTIVALAPIVVPAAIRALALIVVPTAIRALALIVVPTAIRALATIIALIAIPASRLIGLLTSIRLLHALTDSDTHANHGATQSFHLIAEFFDFATKLIYVARAIPP